MSQQGATRRFSWNLPTPTIDVSIPQMGIAHPITSNKTKPLARAIRSPPNCYRHCGTLLKEKMRIWRYLATMGDQYVFRDQ